VGILRRHLQKPLFKIGSLGPHEPLSIGVPKSSRLFVIQDEGVFMRPAGRCQGQLPSVQFAGVNQPQSEIWVDAFVSKPVGGYGLSKKKI
jgi:hypothetical protein